MAIWEGPKQVEKAFRRGRIEPGDYVIGSEGIVGTVLALAETGLYVEKDHRHGRVEDPKFLRLTPRAVH